jgi:hypothetical protein
MERMKTSRAYVKVENARRGWRAKVEIRRHVLAAVTPARAVVFDAFAGSGLMWADVWKDAAAYVGCDLHWHHDARCCFVADNRRVMRCVDLAPFTLFDFDAFGSPWEQALILAARRRLAPGERVGLVLTEGTWIKARTGAWPAALRQACGISRAASGAAGSRMGGWKMHDELITRALRAVVHRMGGRIVRQWRAVGTTAAYMRYLGVVVEGNK